MRRLNLKAIAVLEALIIMAMFCFMVWYFFVKSDSEAVNADVQEPVVRTRPVIEKEETFYQFNGKKILSTDSTYGEVFIPVYADVPQCQLNPDNFVSRNGYSFYTENGEITSVTGIDISQYQGDIDWNQVKSAGIDFVMLRVGYRTYGGGLLTFDERFYEYLEGAKAAGLDIGVYFFSQAVTTEEAIEEADAVLDAIYDYDITYPVVYDWEIISEDHARTDSISVEALNDCCVAFCERVRSAGYTPMIYQNKSTLMKKVDLPRLKDYDLWLAEYNEKPTYYYDFAMWQYTSTGTVPGISGNVDINLCFRNYSAAQTASE